jgi:diacylglycerol kinase (ATP)
MTAKLPGPGDAGQHGPVPRADVILNPHAGSRRRARETALLAAELEARGWEVRPLPTQRAGHARELALRACADAADVVVAAGGDGTVNEVATGLLEAGAGAPPLAIHPRGTSNLVARDLGIPLDARGAARVVVEGVLRALDVTDVGGRTMLACAGVGWDAHVVHAMTACRRGPIELRSWIGPLASALRDYRFPRFRVTPAGGAPVECVMALFLSCRPYARFLVPAPAAVPDDGLLDLVLVRPEGARRLGRLAWRAWRGRMAGDPSVVALRAASAQVDSDGPVPVQVDGDAAGHTPVGVRLRPRRLHVLVPGDILRRAPGDVVTSRP